MPKRELQIVGEHKYVQDNQMISAQYSRGLSLLGQKMIRIAISDINPRADQAFETYTCHLNQLAKDLGIQDSKNVYRDIRKASAELMDTKILIEDKKTKAYRRYTLFSFFDYEPGTGIVTIKFNPDMAQFLLGLRKNFTQIPLQDIIFMHHSKYSIRLYELIKMRLKGKLPAGKKVISLDLPIQDIREVTGTTAQYRQTGQLKQFVIQPSLRDIEEQANLHIEMTEIRTGRKITAFHLEIWSRVAWEYHQKHHNDVVVD